MTPSKIHITFRDTKEDVDLRKKLVEKHLESGIPIAEIVRRALKEWLKNS